MTDTGTVTRDDIKKLCWHLSGWTVEQRDVDALLNAIDGYSGGCGASCASRPGLPGGTGEAVPALTAPAETTAGEVDPQHAYAPETAAQPFRFDGTITVRLVCDAHEPLSTQTATEPDAGPVTEHEPVAHAAPVVPDTTRVCHKRHCEVGTAPQPITEFARNAKGGEERKYVCRTCENKRKREWRTQRRKRAA
jgi:hypothetical protein